MSFQHMPFVMRKNDKKTCWR